jgi:Tol biopolymer transport system component
MYMNIEKDRWTKPSAGPFFYDTFEFEPNFSPDGKKVFYGSRRPLPGQTEPNQNTEIWIVEKEDSGWGTPYPIGSPVSEAIPMFMTATKDGTIYFTANSERGIYRSKFIKGKYTQPERLPDEINFIDNAGHPFVAPDESYVIFDGYSGPGSIGSTDLYISFRDKNDRWSKAVNMGPQVNSKEGEICASVSFDGKYLFYLSSRYGNGDIFWVDAGVINTLASKTGRK